jgi:anti-anti-sigma regulatory factor
MDVTGVKAIDSGLASVVISTASALRLLGAKAVITGIRSEVAQQIVSLNLDLGSLVTRGTLQSGIAYAMNAINASGRLGGRATAR